MTVAELEQRLVAIEQELADLRNRIGQTPTAQAWQATVGMFSNSPEFDEAVRLGREYRDEVNRESLK